MADVTVNASNSPYAVPAPSVTWGQLTIQGGGYLQAEAQTTVTITKIVKQ